MPKEIKEIRSFTKGTVSSLSKEDMPDEAAGYSLDVDNSTEFGILQGRYEDSVFLSTIPPSDHFQTIIKFIAGTDTVHSKDLVYASIIAGEGLNDDGTINANLPPFSFSLGYHPRWTEGAGVSFTTVQP